MKIVIASTKTYVPRFNGNRDLPESEQIAVRYKVPDIQMRRALKPRSPYKFNFDDNGRASGGEVEVSINKEKVVQALLARIDNLEYEDEKGNHKVITWKDLDSAPVQYAPLIDELYDEFSKELDEGIDEKN